MKQANILFSKEQQEYDIVEELLYLPHKILSHYDIHGLVQIVLHELARYPFFEIEKAGYLIDNPEFGCLKGVAGYSHSECHMHQNDVWLNPCDFVTKMAKSSFNTQLTTFFDKNLPRDNADVDHSSIQLLGKQFGMKNPLFLTWNIRHGNYGVLLYEHKDTFDHAPKKINLLRSLVALLSFC